MSFKIRYKPLIDIKINHDYFLDDGTTKFDDLVESQKKIRLSNYNISDYLTITPVLKTQLDLRNHKIVLKKTNRGFMLLVNVDEYTKAGDSSQVFCPKVQPSKDLLLTFELRFKDTYFKNYTNPVEDEENRFYYFSNIRPDGENNSLSIFFKNTKVHTQFLLQPETSRAIMYDIMINEIASIDAKGLENITLINPEDINEPENVALLNTYVQTQKRNGLIGYFRFGIDGRGNNDLLVDDTVEVPNGPDEMMSCLPDNVPDPILRFENRKTLWRYSNIKEDETFITKDEQPLTQNGFIELKRNDFEQPKPKNMFFSNPDKRHVTVEEDNIYSEIFI